MCVVCIVCVLHVYTCVWCGVCGVCDVCMSGVCGIRTYLNDGSAVQCWLYTFLIQKCPFVFSVAEECRQNEELCREMERQLRQTQEECRVVQNERTQLAYQAGRGRERVISRGITVEVSSSFLIDFVIKSYSSKLSQ